MARKIAANPDVLSGKPIIYSTRIYIGIAFFRHDYRRNNQRILSS